MSRQARSMQCLDRLEEGMKYIDKLNVDISPCSIKLYKYEHLCEKLCVLLPIWLNTSQTHWVDIQLIQSAKVISALPRNAVSLHQWHTFYKCDVLYNFNF